MIQKEKITCNHEKPQYEASRQCLSLIKSNNFRIFVQKNKIIITTICEKEAIRITVSKLSCYQKNIYCTLA